MTKIAWVHISDQHFSHADDQRALQQSLLRDMTTDIRSQCDLHRIDPSFLFATGDLVLGSKESDSTVSRAITTTQLDITCQWLVSLQESIGASACLTVPGNHDVLWSATPPALTESLELLVNPQKTSSAVSEDDIRDTLLDTFVTTFRDPSKHAERGALMRHLDLFAHHTRLHRLFPPREAGTKWHPVLEGHSNSDLSYRCHTQIDNILVEILGINTAWTSTSTTKHLASIPTAANHQMARLATTPDDQRLTIVLMHHPIGWMWTAERPDMREHVQRRADFLLRGHEHINWINPFGVATVELSPPATSGTSSHLRNGYLICEYNSDTKMTRIIARQCVEADERFVFESTPHDFADRDKVRLVPISREDARGDISSTAASRRVGYRAGDLRAVAHKGDSGAVLTIDLANFSQLTSIQQLHALDKLWKTISTSLDAVFDSGLLVNLVVGLSPISDGFQIGVKGGDNYRILPLLLDAFQRIQIQVADDGRIITLRSGVCIGDFEIVSTGSRMPCIICGTAANLSRRLAYNTSNSTIALPKHQWDTLNQSNTFSRRWSNHVVGRNDDILFLTHASSAPPATYISLSESPEDVRPAGVLKRAMHAQMQIHSVLAGVMQHCLDDNTIGTELKEVLLSHCHFEVDSVWLGTDSIHMHAPTLLAGCVVDETAICARARRQPVRDVSFDSSQRFSLYAYLHPDRYKRPISGRNDCLSKAFDQHGSAHLDEDAIRVAAWGAEDFEDIDTHTPATSHCITSRACVYACSPNYNLRVGVSSCILSLYCDNNVGLQSHLALADVVHRHIVTKGDVEDVLPRESFVAAWASLQFTTV